MGLDTSHNAWHGPYSSFNDWREKVAQAAGFPDLWDMEGFQSDFRKRDSNREVISWEDERVPKTPLIKLLSHSDCDGELKWQDCKGIADELEKIIDKMPCDEIVGYYKGKTEQFIKGCRLAHSRKENIDFH